MSEQPDKPAQDSKTKTTDTASDAKTGEKQAKTSNNEATVKADKGRETTSASAPSDKTSLDIPSSEEAAASKPRKGNGRNKSLGTRASQKKALDQGLFETEQTDSGSAKGKPASASGTSPLSAGGSKTETSNRKLQTKASNSGDRKTTGPTERSKSKPAAQAQKAGKETGHDKKSATDKKASTAKDKKPAASTKSKVSGKRGSAGARMTSGGDATIERKPALTTTTPIRKRKSDGGGGLAVLVALLFVLVAAGYYFLTQTGALDLAKEQSAEPVVATTEGDEPEAPVTAPETGRTAEAEEALAKTAPAVTPETPLTESPAEDSEANSTDQTDENSASDRDVTSDQAVVSEEAEVAAAPETAGEENNAVALETAAGSTETPEAASPVLLETPETEITTTMANSDSAAAEIAEPATPTELSNAGRLEIEELLIRLQIDPGPADGVIDNQASIAIRLYQEIAGLPVDGKASPELLTELREVVELLSNE